MTAPHAPEQTYWRVPSTIGVAFVAQPESWTPPHHGEQLDPQAFIRSLLWAGLGAHLVMPAGFVPCRPRDPVDSLLADQLGTIGPDGGAFVLGSLAAAADAGDVAVRTALLDALDAWDTRRPPADGRGTWT